MIIKTKTIKTEHKSKVFIRIEINKKLSDDITWYEENKLNGNLIAISWRSNYFSRLEDMYYGV